MAGRSMPCLTGLASARSASTGSRSASDANLDFTALNNPAPLAAAAAAADLAAGVLVPEPGAVPKYQRAIPTSSTITAVVNISRNRSISG